MKQVVREALALVGLRLSRLKPHELYRGDPVDRAQTGPFLAAILPAIEKNAAAGKWPTPDDMRAYFTPRRHGMVRMLIDECAAAGVRFEGRRVLDAGCHAGLLLRQIGARWPTAQLFGCDIDDDKLAMAAAGCPQAEVFFANVFDLPPEPKYDVVFCTQVLEHLVDPAHALARLRSVVAPGGTVVVSVPDGREDQFPASDYQPEFESYRGHINFWSPESWRLFLQRAAPDAAVATARLKSGQLMGAVTSPAH